MAVSDPEVGFLTFSTRQQKDSRESLRSCVQHWICCSTIVSQPAPLSSCFYLSHTHWLSECYSLLPLSHCLSHLLFLFLSLSLLCPTVTLSLTFSWTGKSPQRRSSLDALPMRTLITCGSWHSNRISYALSLSPSLSISLSLSLTHTDQLTHRHAPQRQMGIPAPDSSARPIRRELTKSCSQFYEVRVIKLQADLVYLKTTGPCGLPFHTFSPTISWGVGCAGRMG